jgi:hypothetical protein
MRPAPVGVWFRQKVCGSGGTGEQALLSARWAEARGLFEASLAGSSTPQALDGLGRALWWIGETGEAPSTQG